MYTMLSNEEKNKILNGLDEMGIIDDEIKRSIMKKDVVIKKTKKQIKKILDSSKEVLILLGL